MWIQVISNTNYCNSFICYYLLSITCIHIVCITSYLLLLTYYFLLITYLYYCMSEQTLFNTCDIKEKTLFLHIH